MRRPSLRRVLACVLAVCGGCKGRSVATPSVEGRSSDIAVLVQALEQKHPRFQDSPELRTHLAQAAAALTRKAAGLSDTRFLIELLKIIRLASATGEDGHTGCFPLSPRQPRLDAFPLRLYWFDDGPFVTAAAPEHADLIGAELLALGSADPARLRSTIEPLLPRDNEMTPLVVLPAYLVTSQILHGLDLIDDERAARLTFRLPGGRVVARTLTAEPVSAFRAGEGHPALLPPRPGLSYARTVTDYFWYVRLEDRGAYFVQYNRSLARDPQGRTLQAWSAQLFDELSATRASRLVLDLRNNIGGDNTAYASLLEPLVRWSEDRGHHLVVLIGRGVFSAGMNLATEIKQRTRATFVGEDTAGSLNHYGDGAPFQLPASQLRCQVSTRYWRFSAGAGRARPLSPDVRVPLASGDYFNGRDPILEQALTLQLD
jgi:hypothetical protein